MIGGEKRALGAGGGEERGGKALQAHGPAATLHLLSSFMSLYSLYTYFYSYSVYPTYSSLYSSSFEYTCLVTRDVKS